MDSNCFVENMPSLVPMDAALHHSQHTTTASAIDHLIHGYEPYGECRKTFTSICDDNDCGPLSDLNSVTDPSIVHTFSIPPLEDIQTGVQYNDNSINSEMTFKAINSHMKNTALDVYDRFDANRSQFISQSKLDKICAEVVQQLNCVGMCVIDNFLDDVSPYVHNEVHNLYNQTEFKYGMLFNNNTVRNIRGDLIYWITGNETNCRHIHDLIKTFDLIVFKCNKMNNNGLLGVYNINSRTPAMVACFPGNGSRFMKHADNYSGDGRCITCIYYVNKEWHYLSDGGCLRIYPTQMSQNVPYIDVEPVRDRLVLFWSDRRNLHEVMPTNKYRFAVTVWYFDDEERRHYKHTNRLHNNL